jgi:hypothetical protein
MNIYKDCIFWDVTAYGLVGDYVLQESTAFIIRLEVGYFFYPEDGGSRFL